MYKNEIVAFGGIVGHLNQTRLIKKLIDSDRLPRALLFSGPDGIGKRMVAVETGKILNNRSDAGIRVIGGSKSPKIEDVRDSICWLSVKPYGFKNKVLIVDRAELMKKEVSNALLKLLEEPPDSSYLILVSSSEYTLLPTILSRLFVIRFSKLTHKNVEYILEKQGIPCDELLLKVCRGSPGRAVAIVNSGIDELLKEFSRIVKSGKVHGEIVNFSSRFSKLSAEDTMLFLDSLETLISSPNSFLWFDRINTARKYLRLNVKPSSVIEWLLISDSA